MAIPAFVDEIYFEDGITAVAARPDGGMIAVATHGLIGVYRIERRGEQGRLVHIGSYVVPEDLEVANLFFSAGGARLCLATPTGIQRELSLSVRVEGMLQVSQADLSPAA